MVHTYAFCRPAKKNLRKCVRVRARPTVVDAFLDAILGVGSSSCGIKATAELPFDIAYPPKYHIILIFKIGSYYSIGYLFI